MSFVETDESSLGAVLAANLRAVREQRGMSVRALSARLGDVGYPVVPTGITKAEHLDPARRRRLTTDELAATAVALDTSPAHLLAPAARYDVVAVTPAVAASAGDVAQWVHGEQPLQVIGQDGDRQERARLFALTAPEHVRRRQRTDAHPAVAALVALEEVVRDAVDTEGAGSDPAARATRLQTRLKAAVRYVELLADEFEADGPGR